MGASGHIEKQCSTAALLEKAKFYRVAVMEICSYKPGKRGSIHFFLKDLKVCKDYNIFCW